MNFALFSEHATSVQLCLFPAADATMEHVCVPLGWRTDRIWHAYLPEVRPGQHYGWPECWLGNAASQSGMGYEPTTVVRICCVIECPPR